MFPFFLHLGVHDEERVVREVDRDLAGCVAGIWVGFGVEGGRTFGGDVFGWHDLTYAKLSGDAQGQAADDSTGPEVSQLIGVVANRLTTAIIAIDEGGVGDPVVVVLASQFLAIRVEVFDPILDFVVDCVFDEGFHLLHDWEDLTDVGEIAAVVEIGGLLLFAFCNRVDIEAGGVW